MLLLSFQSCRRWTKYSNPRSSLEPPTPKFQCYKAIRRHGLSGQNKSNPQDENSSGSYFNIEIWGAGLVDGTFVHGLNILSIYSINSFPFRLKALLLRLVAARPTGVPQTRPRLTQLRLCKWILKTTAKWPRLADPSKDLLHQRCFNCACFEPHQ